MLSYKELDDTSCDRRGISLGVSPLGELNHGKTNFHRTGNYLQTMGKRISTGRGIFFQKAFEEELKPLSDLLRKRLEQSMQHRFSL